MNFGGKIVILYLSFVTLIVTLVTLCFKQDVELVSADYYNQEIRFQNKIDAINNEKSLNTSIEHSLTKNKITLTINPDLITGDFKGSVKFFRPSNSKMDKEFKLNFQNNQQVIQSSELTHGAYKLQLSWVSNNKNYFKEEVIFIN